MTEYVAAHSLEEALACLQRYDGSARVIAGGTDLLPDIRTGKVAPRCLVDVTCIPGLDCIELTDDHIKVGAAVTFAMIRDSALLAAHARALVEAAACVGAAPIQNTATWVGNIVQAMPAADGAVVATALEAEALVVDADGADWRPVGELCCGPGVSTVDPTRQLVTHVRFSRPASPTGTAWQRIGRRPSMVLPILNCAVKLSLDPKRTHIRTACVVLGPVAPRPFRAFEAEAVLMGRPPSEQLFARAARIAQNICDPRSNVVRASREYRLAVIPTLVEDALAVAAQRARA